MIDLKKNILFEDADILVINKPAGLVVHPVPEQARYGAGPESISEWFVKKYPQAKDVGEPLGDIERPGIVHRIDRDTSGILLLAKTKAGYECLKRQFQDREVEKIYHLFVYGNVKDDRGIINLPIGKSTSNFRKWSAQRGARGEKRDAITFFQVLKRLEDKSATFVEAKPKTGRTHQIRVHFEAIHHPILGDKLYGPKIVPRSLGEVGQIFERLALHARQITFKDVSGKEITVEASYPEDFKKALSMLN